MSGDVKRCVLQVVSGWLCAWGIGSLVVAAAIGQISWWLVVIVISGWAAFTAYMLYEFSRALDATHTRCLKHVKAARVKAPPDA